MRSLEVIPYGRACYMVESESRNMWHYVDLEPETDSNGCIVPAAEGGEPYFCSCEAYLYHGHRPCKHVLRCVEYILLRVPDLPFYAQCENAPVASAKRYTLKPTKNYEARSTTKT